MSGAQIVHASLIAAWIAGRWRGVLLQGPSGSGKSDLALRAVSEGWRLVADDRVILWASAGRPFGRAPQTLNGLIELRGQGMATLPTLQLAEIAVVAHLSPPAERQPQACVIDVAGAPVTLFEIAPFEASALARLRRIVEQNTARL